MHIVFYLLGKKHNVVKWWMGHMYSITLGRGQLHIFSRCGGGRRAHTERTLPDQAQPLPLPPQHHLIRGGDSSFYSNIVHNKKSKMESQPLCGTITKRKG